MKYEKLTYETELTFDGKRCITVCPYSEYRKVGSTVCDECGFNKKYSFRKKYVICSAEFNGKEKTNEYSRNKKLEK